VFVVDPAVFDRVSKFSLTGLPTVVRLTLPVPVSAGILWAPRSNNAERTACPRARVSLEWRMMAERF
jgi:hypothetical protein